jgi:flagellar protein FliO/FliZ
MTLLLAVACAVSAAAQAGDSNTTTTQSDAPAPEAAGTEAAGGEASAPDGSDGGAASTGSGTSQPERVSEEELAIRDTESAQVQLEGGLTSFTLWDFLRMFLVLGGVIAAIYGVFYVLKRMGNPRMQGNTLISVISTQNLQGNRALHLVEVGNEVFLVGSSEGGVELVSRIEDRETLDQIRLYRSEMAMGGGSFQRTLREMFQRGGSGGGGYYASAAGEQEGAPGEAGDGSSASGERTAGGNDDREQNALGGAFFLQKQRERLKNL